MSIPIATTTITVKGNRPQLDIDPDDDTLDVPQTTLATGVRASITLPTSSRDVDNADESDEYALRCDVFTDGLTRYDTVIDESTGVSYEVRVSALSLPTMLGLRHVKATLRKRKGLASEQPNAS